jgi:hypothetical protein
MLEFGVPGSGSLSKLPISRACHTELWSPLEVCPSSASCSIVWQRSLDCRSRRLTTSVIPKTRLEDVVAVLFSPSSLGLPWEEALRSVLNAFPGAFPILCHGFADNIDWPEVADAGASHSIPLTVWRG